MREGDVLDQVNLLIEMGQEKGFLTYEEINEVLPSEIVCPEQIDKLMIIFGEMDIEILDSPPKAKIFYTNTPKVLKELKDEEGVSIDHGFSEKLVDPFVKG